MRINLDNVFSSELFKDNDGKPCTLLEKLVGKGGEDGFGDLTALAKPLFDDVKLEGFGIVDAKTGDVVWYAFQDSWYVMNELICHYFKSIPTETHPVVTTCEIYHGESCFSGNL